MRRSPEQVQTKILLIRGQKVMLSAHLAELYDVEPRVLVQAVKRNIERFPADFMFQLTQDELANLKSQVVISSWGGMRRAAPYAFTEQGVAMLSTVLLGANALLLGGSDAHRREHLPAVVAGERLLTVAHKERGSRFDAAHVETRATKSGSGFLLAGEKTPVPDGHVADWLIVSARTSGAPRDPGGVTLFALRADTPGVGIERLSRIDSRNAATIKLDDVRVGSESVVGTIDHGGALLARIADRAAIALSAEMLGSMTAALETTVEYLKTRVQFGVLIGTFQALKHRAAKMYIETELTRSAVMAAHRALDESRDDGTIARLASIAKARATDAFNLIAKEGVQMHGGIGMTDEHDIGLFLKRARVAEMTFGDAAWHRDRFARLEGY